ncbi:hypothetical protein AB0K14_31730 [Actinosynnema sp. NPDC050801]|uniref:hypothetical protein n=1 Tax=unclassified Actinosynnema TaxID=2637065 RepID=UPI0033D42FB7
MNWLTPVLALVAGTMTATAAFLGARMTARQRDRTDQREEWFRRFQWATTLCLSESSRERTVGLDILDEIAKSRLAGPDEWKLIEKFSEAALARYPQQVDAPAEPAGEEGGEAR